MTRKNKEEVEQRNQQADEAWKEYQRTGQFVSHEAMLEWFDTWGTGKGDQCPPAES